MSQDIQACRVTWSFYPQLTNQPLLITSCPPVSTGDHCLLTWSRTEDKRLRCRNALLMTMNKSSLLWLVLMLWKTQVIPPAPFKPRVGKAGCKIMLRFCHVWTIMLHLSDGRNCPSSAVPWLETSFGPCLTLVRLHSFCVTASRRPVEGLNNLQKQVAMLKAKLPWFGSLFLPSGRTH